MKVGVSESNRPKTRRMSVLQEEEEEEEDSNSDSEGHSSSTLPVNDYAEVVTLNEMYWIEADPVLKKCQVDFITQRERKFWKDLINKYLKPIDKNVIKEKRIAEDLKSLRDKTVLGFFLLNAMFVMTLILMQMNKDVDFLNINWPLRSKGTSMLEFDPVTVEIKVTRKELRLEPIGLLFLFSFGVIIVIQFVAMLFHRMDTFLHILSTTKLRKQKLSGEEELERYGRYFASVLQRPYSCIADVEGDVTDDQNNERTSTTSVSNDQVPPLPRARRRSTVVDLVKKSRMPRSTLSLDETFEQRFFHSLDENGLQRLTNRRDTLVALQDRRSVILAEHNGTRRYEPTESIV